MRRRVLLCAAVLGLASLLAPKLSQAMTISPPTLDFTLNPGDVIADVIQVYNEEGVPFKVTPVAANFYVAEGDEISGEPDLYGADEVRNGHELAPWFEFNDASVVIPPNERINVPFMIRVPADAQPGSHFGAIQIMSGKPDDVAAPKTSHVGIERAVSVLVFVRVNGDARDDLRVSEFKAQGGLLTHLPADFTIRLDNQGTTHMRPVGNVIIESMFGRQAAVLQVNPGPQYKSVLPGSARRFDVSWFRHRLAEGQSEYVRQFRNFAFGKYTATLLINYGTANQQQNLTAVTTFWVLPWMAILTILFAAAFVVLLIRALLKAYTRSIIRRYESDKKSGTN